MFLRNLVMAIILALFFMCYLKALAEAAKEVNPNKQATLVISDIIKKVFLGSTLNVLLSLTGVLTFTPSNIFICTTMIIFANAVV